MFVGGGAGAAAVATAPTRERPYTHISNAPLDAYPEQRPVQSGPVNPYNQLDVDNLPGYDDASHRSELPSYSQQRSHDDHTRTLSGSALVYSLRQLERRQQAFISMGPPIRVPLGSSTSTGGDRNLTTATEYRVSHTQGAGFSKSKPDILVTSVDREKRLRRESYVPPPSESSTSSKIKSIFSRKDKEKDTAADEIERRKSVASIGTVSADDTDVPSQPIASIRFARSGPMPWTPRATISYAPRYAQLFPNTSDDLPAREGDKSRDTEMRLARSQDRGWIVPIFGREYSWVLGTGPFTLALMDLESGECRATFVYSEHGSWASGGKEIGRLSVPLRDMGNAGEKAAGASAPAEDGQAHGRDGWEDGFLEAVLCSLSVAVQHWRNEGKLLVNAVNRPRGFDEATTRKNAYGWGLEEFRMDRNRESRA